MISFARGIQVGNSARSATSGPASGNHTPGAYSCAPSSAAATAARVSSAYDHSSPNICCAGGWAPLIDSTIRVARPHANSSFVCARIIVCCMMFGAQLVRITWLYTVTLQSMCTRSRGTSTSSKITNASCSSKRLESGLSKRLPDDDTLSRQMNLMPGVDTGTQKASAYASVPGGDGCPGYTAISSANGASVARIRAPRTTMPCAVSATLCSATSLPGAGLSPFDLSIVGCTIVCVSAKSLLAMYCWY